MKRKKFFQIFLGLLAIFCLRAFCKSQTDGFAKAHIYSTLPYQKAWESPLPEKKKLDQFFDQPYSYLGKGAQAYAFVSSDGNYVLKFFKHNKAKHPLSFMRPILPSSLKTRLEKTIEKRRAKLLKDFSSYALAKNHLQEETGILFLHLNQTKTLHKTVTFYDKVGAQHRVSLDEITFVLQEKAALIYPTIDSWIAEGNIEDAKIGLSKLVKLLEMRCKKNIYDKNPDLKTNCGFIGTRPIQFDIGRFKIDENRSDPNLYKDELIRITDRLCKWLDAKAPELSNHIKEEIATCDAS